MGALLNDWLFAEAVVEVDELLFESVLEESVVEESVVVEESLFDRLLLVFELLSAKDVLCDPWGAMDTSIFNFLDGGYLSSWNIEQ